MGKCKICNKDANQIISFGKMPIANGFLRDANEHEFLFDLAVVFCPHCFAVQLGETVKPKMMFNENYQFISSTSNVMARHFEDIALEIIRKVSRKKNPLVVELGCNDGIMLKHIAKKGIRHLGVEPSANVADLARQNGVDVMERFFNEDSAALIKQESGQADIICGANVFCHIEDINSVLKGISILLKDDGILFFEEPYLLDIINKSSFDQIYDEHVYYFSGLSISELAKRHNMQLTDMAHQDVHGGSMRYYLKKGNNNTISENVLKFLTVEKSKKLNDIKGYLNFKTKVDKICSDLKQALTKIKKEGNCIIGYGATSKSTTLLNYAGISPELIDYICDTTPNKINKYTPGTHIPIRAYETYVAEQPLYTLLLAWNHKKEIFEKEKEHRRKGGKFITFFPEVTIE